MEIKPGDIIQYKQYHMVVVSVGNKVFALCKENKKMATLSPDDPNIKILMKDKETRLIDSLFYFLNYWLIYGGRHDDSTGIFSE